MPGKSKLTPGEKVERSGIYTSTKSRKRTTLDKGEKAPPTSEPGEQWKLTTETNPKPNK